MAHYLTLHALRSDLPSKDIYTDLPPIDVRDIYLPDSYLSLTLRQNQRIKLTSTTPFTPTYVKNNVTRSADPDQVYASRVRGRQLLLENPARESKAKKEREEKRAKRLAAKAKRAAGVISPRAARSNGLWKLDRAETK